MNTDNGPNLASALGKVALADAELDEWLVIVLAAILPALTLEIVRALVASDSSEQKLRKIRSLIKLRGYEHSGVGDPHDTVETLISSSKDLKSRRDLALHSYYASHDGEQLRRFRSRKPDTPPVSVSELDDLATQISDMTLQWAAVARQLEHQSAESPRQMDEASMLLEDCRELLPILRLSDDRLAELRNTTEGSVRLAIKGHGRWRILPVDETPDADEQVATLGPNGKIEIVFSDGRVLSGGDTGWLDMTKRAVEHDSGIQFSTIRRVHDTVLFTQSGGQPLPGEYGMYEDSLQKRVFHEGAIDIADALPAYIHELEGFRPSPNPASPKPS